jgi:hypothetical protein
MTQRLLAKTLAIPLIIIAIPLAAIAGIVSTVFGIKEKRAATKVASCIKDFLDGTGGDWDWDDFVSLPIADPRLEDIRRRAAAVDLPTNDEGEATLRALLAEAEGLAVVEKAGAE